MGDYIYPCAESQRWFTDLLGVAVPKPRAAKPTAKIRRWICRNDHIVDPESVLSRRHPALHDVFPSVPAYKIGRSSRSWSRGQRCRFYSWKAQDTLRLDSTLEMHHAMNCEVDPGVTQIVAHPFSIFYTHLGKTRSYTPDLFTIEHGRMKAAEVKMESDAGGAENELRWPNIASALALIGIDFEVFTDLSIRNSTEHNNTKLIFSHRMAELPGRTKRIFLCDFLATNGPSKASILIERFSLSFDVLLALTRHGFISADVSRPIDLQSTFNRGHRPKGDLVREEMFHAETLI